tara:strand:+ start:232 stop:705 length:474 start_codon:yes stop_codon:yes gene_type:complete
MIQATPINQLQSQPEQNKDQLVENILSSYETLSENGDNNTANQEQAEHNSRMAEQQFNSDLGYKNQPQMQEEEEEYYEDEEEYEKQSSFVDNLVNNLKSPILVFILVFIMNFGLLNDILLKNVPRFINSTGGMNYLGVAVKALVAAVIYFSLNKLVL